MKERILSILQDPVSGQRLRLVKFETETDSTRLESVEDIVSGVLISDAGNVYPIYQGVPRLFKGALSMFSEFVETWRDDLEGDGLLNEISLVKPSREFESFILPTLKRFEKEWSEHSLDDSTWGLAQVERIKKVKEYLGWSESEFSGKMILDAGAGTGQLSCSIAKYLDCEVIGMDLTPAVARGWLERKRWADEHHLRLHIVQADIHNPPFRSGAFDAIHCSGVLHHTPNTRRAFNSITPLVKVDGRLAVWLYKPSQGGIQIIPFISAGWLSVDTQFLRRFTTRMNPNILYPLLYLYSSIFHAFYKANEFFRGRRHDQTIAERVTSLFDTLAPPYVFRHTSIEVIEWFEENGFDEMIVTDKENPYGFNVCGVRE